MVEKSRNTILDFVNAPKDEYICIFGKNASECLNKVILDLWNLPFRNAL
jgi:selenocysteine lyase/cysteine desulfurase